MNGNLILKLENAERGTCDLTADLYEAIGCEVIRRPRVPQGIAWRYRGHNGRYVADRWQSMESLTESIDDAMTLLIRPGLVVSIQRNSDGTATAETATTPRQNDLKRSYARTVPLALCIAFLRLPTP